MTALRQDLLNKDKEIERLGSHSSFQELRIRTLEEQVRIFLPRECFECLLHVTKTACLLACKAGALRSHG